MKVAYALQESSVIEFAAIELSEGEINSILKGQDATDKRRQERSEARNALVSGRI